MLQRLGPPGARPVNPGGFLSALELLRERRLLLVRDARGEADVVQQPAVVVEAEQQRADELPLRRVAEAADDAVGGAHRLIFCIPSRSPDWYGRSSRLAITPSSPPPTRAEPPLRRRHLRRGAARAARAAPTGTSARDERLERGAPLGERQLDERLALRVDEQVEHDAATPGLSCASFATRLSAGWMRSSSSSNESSPPAGTTISPSSTNRFAAHARAALDQSGK